MAQGKKVCLWVKLFIFYIFISLYAAELLVRVPSVFCLNKKQLHFQDHKIPRKVESTVRHLPFTHSTVSVQPTEN